MDLLLHIGCEKTGTSSVQQWLHQNDQALARHGIVYTKSLGRPSNRRISHYGLEAGTPDEALAREGIRSPEQYAELQARIANALREEVRQAEQAGAATFVISSEHCHSRLKTEAAVARVHALLAPLFSSIRVLCVLRPQIDSCLSLASSLTRFGGAISRDWVEREMRPNVKYYALHQLLTRWAGVFGPQSIDLAAFRRCPNSIELFEQRLGLTEAGLPRGPAINEALDFRVIALVNAMNADHPERSGDHAWARLLEDLPLKQRLTLDLASAQALQARFDQGNAALCADWPRIDPADLTPDWANYPEQGNIDRLNMADELGPFFRHIVDRLRCDVMLERARLLAMTSERDAALKRPQAALQTCGEALTLFRQALQADPSRRPVEGMIAELERRERRLTNLVEAGAGA
jgi:hypothetical protein